MAAIMVMTIVTFRSFHTYDDDDDDDDDDGDDDDDDDDDDDHHHGDDDCSYCYHFYGPYIHH